MSAYPTCPACESAETTSFVEQPEDVEYFVKRNVEAIIRRCGNCRSLFQDPWPSEAETATFYGPHYNNYAVSKVPLLSSLHYAAMQKEVDRFIAAYGTGARVLDYGCGHASFLNGLFNTGCESVAGYDFTPDRPALLAEGIPYFSSEEALTHSGETYDVIRLNHVIEHLTDYPHTLGMLRSLLSEGGIIMGQTPNGGHYTASLFRRRWGNLHYPYHTLLFSRSGLTAIARRTGFDVMSITQTFMPTGWAMGLENWAKACLGWRNQGRTMIYTGLIAATAPLAIFDRLAPWTDTNIINFQLKKTAADRLG